MTPPKMFYSTADMERDLAVMYRQMHLDRFVPDVVVGITRGGLVPSVYVSHYFNKPLKTIEVSFRDSNVKEQPDFIVDLLKAGKKVLIVDDICDSGETLEWLDHQIKAAQPFDSLHVDPLKADHSLKYMVLIHNDACKNFVPEYTGTHVNKALNPVWIVFPFEQRD